MSTATQTENKPKRPLMPRVPDFCPACNAVDHPFISVHRKVEQEFRGETLDVDAPAMSCQHCGFEIAAPGNLDALRLATMDAYRRRHYLLTSEQIVSRRKAMGMSQREFAEHVGIGVASLQRWEKGLVVQDKASDLLIRERTKHIDFISKTKMYSEFISQYIAGYIAEQAATRPDNFITVCIPASKLGITPAPSGMHSDVNSTIWKRSDRYREWKSESDTIIAPASTKRFGRKTKSAARRKFVKFRSNECELSSSYSRIS